MRISDLFDVNSTDCLFEIFYISQIMNLEKQIIWLVNINVTLDPPILQAKEGGLVTIGHRFRG